MLVGTLAPGAVWRKHDALNFARMLAFVNEIPMSHTFAEAIRGSPWINMLGRLRGTRIGRDAFIDTLAVNDYDLPHIGDRAVIARNATIFCHLGARSFRHLGACSCLANQQGMANQETSPFINAVQMLPGRLCSAACAHEAQGPLALALLVDTRVHAFTNREPCSEVAHMTLTARRAEESDGARRQLQGRADGADAGARDGRRRRCRGRPLRHPARLQAARGRQPGAGRAGPP